MWRGCTSWIERLDFLPGLNLEEKSRARVIILSKPREDRELYFTGTYAEVAATIRALLRETPIIALEAAASSLSFSDASALSLPSCCTTTTITRDSITTCHSRATMNTSSTTTNTTASAASSRPSSTSSASSSASRRPPATAILVQTAAAVRDLATLPAAFRAAHFWASQPGDVYCRTVRKLVPITVNSTPTECGSVNDGEGSSATTVIYERVETRFAIVVGSTPPSKDGSSPGAVIAVRIRAAETCRRWQRPPTPLSLSRSGSGTSRASGGSAHAVMAAATAAAAEEYESDVVPDPRDGLDALNARLDRREVRTSDVLWWDKGPGKWALWDGSPQRAWFRVATST